MNVALRVTLILVVEDILGLKAKEVVVHSIRLGVAMPMYLGKCPVYTIMIIVRWSSDGFLLYIRKQVEQFSHNVSISMIRFVNSSDTSQIWHLKSPILIQDTEITPTMPRQGEMLVVTWLGVSSFLPFPCSTDDKMLV